MASQRDSWQDQERREYEEDHQGDGNGIRVEMRTAQERIGPPVPTVDKIRKSPPIWPRAIRNTRIRSWRKPEREAKAVVSSSSRPKVCAAVEHQRLRLMTQRNARARGKQLATRLSAVRHGNKGLV